MTRLLRILFAAVALSTAFGAAAETEKTADSSHFGVRVQLDFNTAINESDIVKWGPGASVGIAYYAPFGRITYLSTGLLFSYDTFKYAGWAGSKYSPRYFDGHMAVTGLRLPLDIGFKILQNNNVKLSLYTGPHFYVDFKCRAKYDCVRTTWVDEIDKDYTTPGFEIAWAAGAAVDFKRHWHLHFDFTLGLSHMAMTEDILLNEKTNFQRAEMSVGLGYNF